MILYNHVHGRPSRNVYCGPSGCGKTFIWDIIKRDLYEYVIIANSANMSKSGFIGNEKPYSPLFQIEEIDEDYIMVYDEFDKLCTPAYASGGDNVSASIQSELLALIQPSQPYIKIKSTQSAAGKKLKIDKFSWVFCGSFMQAAENIAKSNYSSGLGFDVEKKESKAFENELLLQDLINFGMIPELAGRMNRLTNLRPLTLEDYKYLITDFGNSPVRNLEEEYGLPEGYIRANIISNNELNRIASEAYESGLGVRSAYSYIQRLLDNYIFENFDQFSVSQFSAA